MRYFSDLRTEIEKQGLPAAMAEMCNIDTGVTMADVACGEDQFGIWISGAVRFRNLGGWKPGEQPDLTSVALRNFRMADPPLEHEGRPLTDFRFATLADLAIKYLSDRVLRPTITEFEDAL